MFKIKKISACASQTRVHPRSVSVLEFFLMESMTLPNKEAFLAAPFIHRRTLTGLSGLNVLNHAVCTPQSGAFDMALESMHCYTKDLLNEVAGILVSPKNKKSPCNQELVEVKEKGFRSLVNTNEVEKAMVVQGENSAMTSLQTAFDFLILEKADLQIQISAIRDEKLEVMKDFQNVSKKMVEDSIYYESKLKILQTELDKKSVMISNLDASYNQRLLELELKCNDKSPVQQELKCNDKSPDQELFPTQLTLNPLSKNYGNETDVRVDELQKKLNHVTKQYAALEAINSKLIESQNEDESSFQENLNQLEERANFQQLEMDAITAQINNLTSELSQKNTKINDLLALNSLVQQNCSDLENQNNKLRSDLSEARLAAEQHASQSNLKFEELQKDHSLLSKEYAALEFNNLKLQDTNEKEATCSKDLMMQLELKDKKLRELNMLVLDLQRTVDSKVVQNVELSVQFDELNEELNQYRVAAISSDPKAMSAVYAKAFSSQEIAHLRQVIKNMQRDIMKLEVDMSQSIIDMKEKMQNDGNDEKLQKYAALLQDLLVCFSSKSKVYRESFMRDSQRISTLERELKQLAMSQNQLSNLHSRTPKASRTSTSLFA